MEMTLYHYTAKKINKGLNYKALKCLVQQATTAYSDDKVSVGCGELMESRRFACRIDPLEPATLINK